MTEQTKDNGLALVFLHALQDKVKAMRLLADDLSARHNTLTGNVGVIDNLLCWEAIDQIYLYANDLEGMLQKYFPEIFSEITP